jgi:hypothetical protein
MVIRHMWQLKTVVFLHWCLKQCSIIYTEYIHVIKLDLLMARTACLVVNISSVCGHNKK